MVKVTKNKIIPYPPHAWIWFILIILFTLILILIAMGRWVNYKVLFQPKHTMIWSPINYKDLYLIQGKENGKSFRENQKINGVDYINVWYFKPFDDGKVVLYCHGNNDNNSYRDYVIDICRRFGLNLLLVDYRGYGKSDGRPTSDGIVKDVKSAYGFLSKLHKADDIIIWGESLGGSAAIRIAAERPCHKLILLSTFASLPDIMGNVSKNKFSSRYLRAASWLLLDSIESKVWIQKVKCPVAIIHSQDDDLIPYKNAKILFENVKHNNKMLITIKGIHSVPLFSRDDLTKVYKFIHPPNDDESNVSGPNQSDIENIINKIRNL